MSSSPILQGLPNGVQDIINSDNSNQFDATKPAMDSGVARIPAPQVPMRPAGQVDDTAPPDMEPKSLADRLASAFLLHLTEQQQPQKPANGSFGSKLTGALNAAATGLSDMRTGSPQGGWLGAVGATLAARNERVDREKQQQFQNAEEKRKNDSLIARNQAETVQTMRNVYRQDAEMQQQAYARGAASVEHLRPNYDVQQEDVGQDELKNLVTKNPDYLQTHYVFPTGSEPVLDSEGKPKVDANGNPVTSPLYAIVSRTPKNGQADSVEVTPEMSRDFEKYTGQKISAGAKINIDLFKRLSNETTQVETAISQLNKGRSELLSQDQQRQLQSDLENGEVQHALASTPNNPLKGLGDASKIADSHIQAGQQALAVAQQKGDQQGIAAAQKTIQDATAAKKSIDNVISNGFSVKDRYEYATAEEKAKHDREEEAIQNRRLDVQAQKETEQKGLGQSYAVQNKEYDALRKPLQEKMAEYDNLSYLINQQTAEADALIAPALLKAMVAGGGVRITKAEVDMVMHGRSTAGDLEAAANKLKNGKSISTEQRQQLRDMATYLDSKVKQQKQVLEDGQAALDNAESIAEQRAAVRNTRTKLAQVDAGTYNPNQSSSQPSAQPKQPAPQTHVFDSKAWAAANPKGDVNAAIAAAKQQGYQVK